MSSPSRLTHRCVFAGLRYVTMNTATMKKRQHMQLRLQPERNFDTLNLDGGGGSGETGTRSVTWSPPFVDDADDAVAAAPDEHISDCSVGAPVPVSPSPSIATPTLSLPSPYYDRNPVVGFPKSPPPVLANVPLQNVYDGHDHHLMDGSKVRARFFFFFSTRIFGVSL